MAEPENNSSFLPARLVEWLDLGVKGGAIFAGVFAIHQYLEAREDARIARTLDYVERFGDARTHVGAASQRIAQKLWETEDQIEDLHAEVEAAPPADAEVLLRQFSEKLVEGTSENPGLRTDVDEVVAFFEALVICIEARVCDRATALAFFGTYLDGFWRHFGPSTEARGSLAPNFANGIQRLRDWHLAEEKR
jgi:hypothetical protein